MSLRHLKYLAFPNCSKVFLLLSILFLATPVAMAKDSEKDSLLQRIHHIKSRDGFSVKDTTYINLLNKLASVQRFYKTDSLLSLAKQALKHSKSVSYNYGEGQALLLLGEYYSDKGDSKSAISYFQRSYKIATKIDHAQLILRSNDNLASEHKYKGDYENALNGYLVGIELAEKYGDKRMLSITNENIASLYVAQRDYQQAQEFYKEVKKINEEINIEVNSAETFSNMASMYADMGKLEYAMFNINSSIATFEKHHRMDWLAYSYEVKGKIYLKQDNYKWALFWYNQSEKLHEKLQDERAKIDLLNGIAEAYLGLGKDNLSEQYALRAYKISNDINFYEGTQKCAKTLYKISKNKKDHATALAYHEIYQQLTDTLTRSENQKSLTLLKTKLDHDKQKADFIREKERQLDIQSNYVNAAFAILIIFITITFLIHRSEKIQKNLNTELRAKTLHLEKNEIALKEINETKDKLFSIIAHDLRGPIGAFQGLLDLFRCGEIGKEEFLNFIPKLGQDIDHISFTLNNLLSWGQTQMNGSVTKPSNISLENLVEENVNLLSEIAAGKGIQLKNNLTPNTLAWSDGDQIDIVIRNLISNALKFTPVDGTVTLAAYENEDHWQISVTDTGVGMDKETIDKLFTKNANITTYGTNNEKGTGLGLGLCKEMVEKNNGTIWVESMVQRGTSFYFTVPKAKGSYQKAG